MAIYRSSTPTKDGRSYFFKTDYYVGDKRKQKRSKCFATKIEALKAEYQFLIKWEESKIDVPISMNMQQLFNHFIESRKIKGVKSGTIRQYTNQFKNMAQFHKTKCINFQIGNIEEWKKHFGSLGKYTLSEKNRMIKLIKSLLIFGMTEYGFDYKDTFDKVTPFVDNEVQTVVKFYNEDEVVKFLKVEDDLRYKCLWMMLFYEGLKTGEIKGLTWNCISFRNKTVTVKQQLISGRNADGSYNIERLNSLANIRTLPLIRSLKRNLFKYYCIVKQQEGFNKKTWFVFGESFGRVPLNYSFAVERKREIAQKKKLNDISFTEFRHTCAYLLLTHGANIIAVSKFLGYYEVTDCLKAYSFMLPLGMTEVVDIINKLNNEYNT